MISSERHISSRLPDKRRNTCGCSGGDGEEKEETTYGGPLFLLSRPGNVYLRILRKGRHWSVWICLREVGSMPSHHRTFFVERVWIFSPEKYVFHGFESRREIFKPGMGDWESREQTTLHVILIFLAIQETHATWYQENREIAIACGAFERQTTWSLCSLVYGREIKLPLF